MSSEHNNFLRLMKANQWQTRAMIDSKPITIIIQDALTKNGEEFVIFVDQDNNQRTLRADLIEVPTFTME
jgi:hypothetical protein